MFLSEAEMLVLYHVGRGMTVAADVAEAMGVPEEEVQDAIITLRSKLILDKGPELSVAPNPFAIRLMHILTSEDRARVLSGGSLDILSAMLDPATEEGISQRTGIPVEAVSRHIGELRRLSVVRAVGEGYTINDAVWKDLGDLLRSMYDLQAVADPRVPVGMTLHHADPDRAMFSGRPGGPWRRTAFSVFPDFGIGVLSDTDYYTTYAGEVGTDMAFDDAFLIAESTGDYRQRMLVLMFYLRNRDVLTISDGFRDVLECIIAGEAEGWPAMSEVRSKFEQGLRDDFRRIKYTTYD